MSRIFRLSRRPPRRGRGVPVRSTATKHGECELAATTYSRPPAEPPATLASITARAPAGGARQQCKWAREQRGGAERTRHLEGLEEERDSYFEKVCLRFLRRWALDARSSLRLCRPYSLAPRPSMSWPYSCTHACASFCRPSPSPYRVHSTPSLCPPLASFPSLPTPPSPQSPGPAPLLVSPKRLLPYPMLSPFHTVCASLLRLLILFCANLMHQRQLHDIKIIVHAQMEALEAGCDASTGTLGRYGGCCIVRRCVRFLPSSVSHFVWFPFIRFECPRCKG
jgi:hypothetical protein